MLAAVDARVSQPRPHSEPEHGLPGDRVHVEVTLLPGEVSSVKRAIAWIYLWGPAAAGQHASFWDECRGGYRNLVRLAEGALPSATPGVEAELWPAEPALFESSRGVDEVRLRIRVTADTPAALAGWLRALYGMLRLQGVPGRMPLPESPAVS